MNIYEVGYYQKHEPFLSDDTKYKGNCWLLMLVKSKAVLKAGGREVHAPASSVAVFTPGNTDIHCADGGELISDWMFFAPTKEETALMKELDIPMDTFIPIADIAQLSGMVRNICCEQYSAHKNRRETVDLYFQLLIYKLNEYISSGKALSRVREKLYFEKLLWLRECIYRWPARAWSIDEMAAEVSLSRSRLQHLYTETFGISISKDIITSRLDKAVDLLKDPDLSISEIAAKSGYENHSYFNRRFRTAYGKTPSDYREELVRSMNK